MVAGRRPADDPGRTMGLTGDEKLTAVMPYCFVWVTTTGWTTVLYSP